MGPRRRNLTARRVLDSAIGIADADGVEAITLRRLAEVLGVHPTSIYNHVPTKEAILDGICDVMLEEAAIPSGQVTWQEWVRDFAAGMRRLSAAHPGGFQVFTRRAARGPVASRITESGLDAFRRGGFSPAEASYAVAGVSLALMGMALNEPRSSHTAAPPETGPGLPRIAEAAAAAGTLDGMWTLMVDSLVHGLSARASGR